jgi:hypothetical protein
VNDASVAGPTQCRGFASLSTQIDVARRRVARIRRVDMALSRATARGAVTMHSRISMPRSALARELSRVEEQVAKDPHRIAHQRGVVSHHEEGGLDSAIARAILDQLETLQRVHIADRDRLLAEAAPENKPPGK